MSTLERAVAIAAEAHAGQVDKGGRPYLLHPLRLMLQMEGFGEKIVAVLHDVVEDSGWTLDRLRREGFSESIIDAIDAVTHRDNEPYEEYILRAGRNEIACRVKLADLRDNSDIGRISNPTKEDAERIEKYKRALALLETQKPNHPARHYFILEDPNGARARLPRRDNPHLYSVSIWSRQTPSEEPPEGAVAFSELAENFWIVRRQAADAPYMEACSTAEIASLLDNGGAVTIVEGPFNLRYEATDCLDAMWEAGS